MRPVALLRCLARVAVQAVGGAVGLGGAAGLAAEVMREWEQQADAAGRRAELERLVRIAADEFRGEVEVVVREAAAGRPAAVVAAVTAFLSRFPDHARGRLRRPDDLTGTSLPPGLRLDTPADLAAFLPPVSAAPPATEDEPDDAAQVVIRYTAGPAAGREDVFTEPAILLFGRAADCDPRLPQDGCGRVSRRHCILEANPPDVRVRDLGSKHGTFVDGHLLGKRPKGADPAPGFESPDHALADGAEVRLSDRGEVAFTVRVSAPARTGTWSCAQCSREVAEAGAGRPGAFVCADCRREAGTVVSDAAAAARAGDPELLVLQDYELGKELGHGGMGAVYLARHVTTGAPAAVKVMLPKVAAGERAVAHFRREIRNTAALDHPNVVRCLGHGFSRGAFFLVLEYCDGGSVDRRMANRGGTLPPDDAVGIALQALEGLEYAHHAPIPFVRRSDGSEGTGAGLVHRDIKPANLFLAGAGGTVRVGDYGLAKAFDDCGLTGGTRTGDYAGTPKYMCRKQVIGYKTAGPEVDVWSLAATLYAMLTGHAPRDFPSGMDPWLCVLEDDPVPVRRRNPAVPARLAEVVDEALQEPEMPFRTAAALRQALAAVV
ncbi:protein kinase domain-containing protein [Urbifossiella limnaea]|uniref:Serine/threonine-protein kinase PknB n=1 Tax=Urbifossiella limnaea TaxID=2528023 RepID=A0A517Y210_9BACT|nr:FHA domain-containing serine/threonine-protein kinase [Urbifossiella limnaea]QDU23779.1 Serine/threonine-protein kinase PknB [Urbifossiella limnaea]